jgi:hypothetical protein
MSESSVFLWSLFFHSLTAFFETPAEMLYASLGCQLVKYFIAFNPPVSLHLYQLNPVMCSLFHKVLVADQLRISL